MKTKHTKVVGFGKSNIATMMDENAIFTARSPDRKKHLRRGGLEKQPVIWRNGMQFKIVARGKLVRVG